MRGKDANNDGFEYFNGITPAYAGKSLHVVGLFVNVQDHPRLCGEKETDIQARNKKAGSPPPMRGKAKLVVFPINVLRITPAYAGKRFAAVKLSPALRDHPRLCGEKVILNRFTAFTIGSPPPMRGKVHSRSLRGCWGRITPAYAGKR